MSCTSLGSSPKKGQSCGSRYPEGLIIFQSDPGALDIDSAKSLSFWQNLLKQDEPNGVFVVWKFDQSTPGDAENKTQELNVKGQAKTGETPAVDDYRVEANLCSYESLLGAFEDGRDVFVLKLNNSGTIEGRRNEWGKINPVNVRIFASDISGKTDAIAEVVLSVSWIENYKKNAYGFTPDFTFKALEAESVISLKWGSIPVNTATEIQIDAYDCNDAAITDLTVGADGVHMFGAYDRTAGAELTIDTVAVSGNRYTLTFGAGIRVATNTIEIYYKEPSVTDQLYRNSKRAVVVNP